MTLFLGLVALLTGGHLVFSLLQAFRKGAVKRERPALPLVTDHVSIIIPAWNDAAVLERTLCSLATELDTFPRQAEVFIVAGGKDESYAQAEALRNRLARTETATRWLVLAQQPRGKNAALNQALTLATHDILIFLDADTEVCPGWLNQLSSPIASGQADATTGCFESYTATPVSAIFELDQLVSQRLEERATLFGGGSIALSKKALESLGGKLPEDVLVGVDWDLSERVRGAGLRRTFVPNANVRTELPQTWRDYWQTEVRWRRAFYHAELRHFQLRPSLHRLLGLIYVPGVQALLLSGWLLLPCLFYSLGYAMGEGLALWLIFTLWVLGRHGANCLKAYAFTSEKRWLTLFPTYLWSFCVSAAATWKALFTLRKITAHFKGRRAGTLPQ
jgi:cellulose synthase/poly-beta-1,6-N-acetylglucosamine synthase-like glycosyltransferase